MTTLEKEGSQPEEKEEAWNIFHFLKETTAVEKIRRLSEYEKLPNLNEKWRKGKSSVLFWFSYVKEFASSLSPERLFFD